ncbi:MAG: DegT/DnrJ/EryC1/StrS family aminotransferase, partial [Chloroflexota bacterium]
MISVAKPMLGGEEEAAVLEVLRSGQIAQGARVQQFEEQFAAEIGAKIAVAS